MSQPLGQALHCLLSTETSPQLPDRDLYWAQKVTELGLKPHPSNSKALSQAGQGVTPDGPRQWVHLGNSVAHINKRGSWTCRLGNTKPKSIKPLSERAAASLTRAFAMQSSPAPARRGQLLRGGLGRPKSSHFPPSRPRVPGNL